MHPALQRAQEESATIFARARAELENERDIRHARLMSGESEPQPLHAPKPKPESAPPAAAQVPSEAEIERRRLASFAQLSPADQALLARFGAAPLGSGVAASAPRVPQPAQSFTAHDLVEFNHGAMEAARLLGRPAPAAVDTFTLRHKHVPDPRLDAAEMERGAREALRLLGRADECGAIRPRRNGHAGRA